MKTERWEWVKRLLDEAILLSPAERSSYLELACGSDHDLLNEVKSLLAAHEQAGTEFLKSPAVDLRTQVPAAMTPREGRRIGVYQILEKIGRGGMGEVYRAVRADGQYTKEVAIKLVRGGFDSRLVQERFLNERQILASLDHPNIARLLDGGATDEGVPYLVMELIEGKPIDQYCDAQKLSVTERLRLFQQVCAAVQYAHQRLVIHRDIKPSNVMVTEDGVPKLLDFGIAKIVNPVNDAQTTLTLSMTPEYASPEQIRGEPITTATDVYSLGVVLYQLMTGRSPYPADTRTPHRLAQAVCETEPGRPSTVVVKAALLVKGQKTDAERFSGTREGTPAKLQRRLAGDMDDILLMALRKEPARRYGSVDQFAEDIRRHLAGLPVAASKGSWRYKAQKFLQRNRLGITAAAIVTLAVVGGVGATVREARIAAANGRRAEARFNDVRVLANSLIFEVDDAIANLPGSTPARKLLVDKAVKYLDTLSKEANGDPALQREMAGAYQKLADVQGNPYRANLGDSAAAMENYRKALAIRQTLAAANPGNKDDQIALAYTSNWMGALILVTSGNLEEGLAYSQNALKIMEPLAKANPDDIQVLSEVQQEHEVIGDIQGGNGSSANLGDVGAALENHRQAISTAERILRARPNDIATRRKLGIYYRKVGDDLVKLGDRTGAIESDGRALEIYNALSSGSVNTNYMRTISSFYQQMGNVQMMNGDSPAALKTYRTSIDIAEKLATDDPTNALAKLDLGLGYSLLGNATAHAGRQQDGLALLQRSVDLLNNVVEHDPKLSFARRIQALAYQLRGQILFTSGKLDAALTDYKKAASILEAIVASDAADVQTQIILAATNSKIAGVLAEQGEDGKAREIYGKVLAVVEPLAHSLHPSVEAQYATADTYSGLGNLLMKQGSRNGVPTSQQMEFLTQAHSWLEQSSAEWQRVPNPGTFSPSGFDTAGPSRVAQEISSCNGRMKALRERSQARRP